MDKRLNVLRRICIFCMAFSILLCFSACGKEEIGPEATEEIKDGEVSSPEEFRKLGLYIDVTSPNITDVKYSIESGEIAVVSFVYNGIECQFRGSCTYDGYVLAGINDTSTGNMISTYVKGYGATYFTLVPGRIVFWDAGHVNYSFYTFVTASDDIIQEITECLTFEDCYNERADVKAQVAKASEEYARQIITAFENKNTDLISDMMYYPQMLGDGESVANKEEFLAIDKDKLFSDILLKALSDDAIDSLRTSEDGEEFIVGTNYKNVHFKQMEDGSFKIIKINN